MDTQTFSRAFLQGIPEQRKQQHIETIIQNFISDLQNIAGTGRTTYLFDPAARAVRMYYNQWLPEITTDDYISAFKRKFPDCAVSWQEKGILIDWT
jgi:hypothetical protein